jgi:hypothetical protein
MDDEAKVLVRRGSERAPAHTSPLWRSCCVEIDPRAVIFFTSVAFAAFVLGLCSYLLLTRSDCGSQQFAASVITFIVGVMLPSPVIKPANPTRQT